MRAVKAYVLFWRIVKTLLMIVILALVGRNLAHIYLVSNKSV